jgi:hypothetical protein
LLSQFPVTESVTSKISRTDAEPETVEREKLLNESMAQHRDELKKLAKNLMRADKLKAGQNGWRLLINSEEWEILFQIINDIRVGCWRELGEPENLELKTSPPSDVINALELAGKVQTEKSPQEISQVVHKVGTNRLLSRKTVTFSFSEPYDLIPSLLASRPVSTLNTSSSLGDETGGCIKWCTQ